MIILKLNAEEKEFLEQHTGKSNFVEAKENALGTLI